MYNVSFRRLPSGSDRTKSLLTHHHRKVRHHVLCTHQIIAPLLALIVRGNHHPVVCIRLNPVHFHIHASRSQVACTPHPDDITLYVTI